MILTADCTCDAMLVNPYCAVRMGEDICFLHGHNNNQPQTSRLGPDIELSEAKMSFHPRIDARGRRLVEVSSPSPSFAIFWEALKHDHVCHKCMGVSFTLPLKLEAFVRRHLHV